MIARATELRLKTIIDLVPNHCSSENVHFKAALAAAPGSPERDMFIFRDGKGETGELPPNNWKSHFEGSAWTRVTEQDGTAGQWYLHLFDTSQPDFNWDNPAVHAEFERILRFWLDKGVTGFRVDVAHALVKKAGLPDWSGKPNGKSSPGFPGSEAPMFGQPEVHDIFRSWRKILDSYEGDRVLCAEANVDPAPRIADWVRKDEMHQAFNFSYLYCGWDASALRNVIKDSLEAFDAVGAPTTWVLSNHDKVRHATRFGAAQLKDGIGPDDVQPDAVLGLSRARAATLAMLALPGSAYLYQGEELGLPDNTMIAPEFRQDPSFFRSGGKRIGRDGCRVPLPWSADESTGYGFEDVDGVTPWLPQPESWGVLSREVQREDPNSTLSMYTRALWLRKEHGLGSGSFAWASEFNGEDGIIAFTNGSTKVIMNMGAEPVEISGPIVLASEPGSVIDGYLIPNRAVWITI
jgi:alpha-glucosidase